MADDFNYFFHDELDCIQQNSYVDAFHHHFEASRGLKSSLQPWLLEEYFASRFMYDLHEDIQGLVLIFQLITIIDAFKWI